MEYENMAFSVRTCGLIGLSPSRYGQHFLAGNNNRLSKSKEAGQYQLEHDQCGEDFTRLWAMELMREVEGWIENQQQVGLPARGSLDHLALLVAVTSRMGGCRGPQTNQILKTVVKREDL
jgi:hypothetical protein